MVVTDIIREKEQNGKDPTNNKIAYPPAFYVNCDPQKISQVIFNLLDNVMKFSTKGKIFVYTFLINGKEQRLKYHKNTNDTNNKFAINTNDNIISPLDGDKNNIIIIVEDMD